MSTIAKAIMAAVLGFVGAFIAALLPYATGQVGDITLEGWLTAVLAGVVFLTAGGGLVYVTPNAPKE